MQGEWDARVLWRKIGSEYKGHTKTYYKELQGQEQSLISGFLNLYSDTAEGEDREWAQSHKDLETFYQQGMHEPIPFDGQKFYHTQWNVVRECDPTGWPWHPERQQQLQTHLLKRQSALETLLAPEDQLRDPRPEREPPL